jgi:threonine/homoserine/homoserine lactone efflux protein
MTLTGLVIFAVAYALAVASPGPGVMGVVAHVMGRGMAGVGAFIAGIVLGDFVWLTCAVLGLAALAHTFETAFLVVKWLGVAYLAWLPSSCGRRAEAWPPSSPTARRRARGATSSAACR